MERKETTVYPTVEKCLLAVEARAVLAPDMPIVLIRTLRSECIKNGCGFIRPELGAEAILALL